MLAAARQSREDEDDRALRGVRGGRGRRTRALRLGVLHMAPADKDSSYNSQHPIDIAAALTSYDPNTKIGVLSFSVPHYIAQDKCVPPPL